jgi:hypothetical protein
MRRDHTDERKPDLVQKTKKFLRSRETHVTRNGGHGPWFRLVAAVPDKLKIIRQADYFDFWVFLRSGMEDEASLCAPWFGLG